MDTAETPNFGLTRIAQGETIAKDGFKALDGDRLTVDALLRALEFHTHDAAPRLPDPPEDVELAFTASASGGQLPAGVTFYYCVSLLDRWGLETAVCAEGEAITPSPMAVEGAPAVTAVPTGGSLTPGQYTYVYTFVSATGGETDPSPATSARIVSGSTSSCVVDLPDLPETALYANIYRSRDGQSQFFYCGEHDGLTDTFTDTGADMDYTVVAPRANTTGSTCSIQVSLAEWPADVWNGVFGWRLYRATTPGGYTGTSLVHEVVETESEESAVLLKTWLDVGDEMEPGLPKTTSSTVSGGAVVDMDAVQGQLPVAAMPRGAQSITFYGPVAGTMFDGFSQFPKIRLPYDIRPISFQLSTTGVTGRSPGSPAVITLLSTGGATVGEAVALTLDDNSGLYSIEWPTTATVRQQGESMDRSSGTAVLGVSDLAASSGAAAELDGVDEYIEGVFNLEPGPWHLRVRHRFNGTPNATDLHYHFFDDTSTELADVEFEGATEAGLTYTTVTPPIAGGVLNWPGGNLRVRISKSSTSDTAHLIDYVEMYTDVPTIPAGQAYISYSPPAGGNVGTDHFYTLWY